MLSLFFALKLKLEQVINYHPAMVALDTPVVKAIALLSQQGINGCVLVVEGKRFVSIFTEHDVVTLVASGKDIALLSLGDVIDVSVTSLIFSPTQTVQAAWSLMREQHLLNLPIINDQGDLVGLVSQSCLMAAVEAQTASAHLLKQSGPQGEFALAKLDYLDHPLQTLAENSPYIIFRLDRQLRHCYISPNIEEAFGIPSTEFIGKSARELGFPIEVCDVFESACHLALEIGSSSQVEFRLFDRDYSVRLIPDQLLHGEVISLLGIGEDITERSKMSADLQGSEAKLNRILDSADVAISSFRVFENYDFEYEYWSAGWESLSGFSVSELMENKFLWLSQVVPEDRENIIMPLFQDFFAERNAAAEYRFRCKDCSIRCFFSTYTSQKSEAGYWNITAFNADITERKAAEMSQKRSLSQLHFTLQATQTMYFEHSLKTNDVHQASSDSDDDLQSITTLDQVFEYAHLDDRKKVLDAVKSAIAQTSSLDLEFRVKCPDETQWSWKLVRGLVLLDELDQPERLVGVSVDITDRKTVELALNGLTRELQELYDKAPCGYFSLDEDDRIVRVNETQLNMLGYRWDEMMGHSITEFLSPDSVDKINQIKPLLKIQSCLSDIELKMISRDNSAFAVRINATALYDQLGHYSMGRFVVMDVNERAAIELERDQIAAALQVSEEQRRLALDLTDTALWNWNIKTGSCFWSEKMYSLLGLPEGVVEPSYTVWQVCVHPDDLRRVEAAISLSLKAKTIYSEEYRVIHPDESIHWVLSKGHGIYDDADCAVRMLGISIDISDRKKIEYALQKNEAQLRLALNSTQTVCWQQDLNACQITYSSQETDAACSNTISIDVALERMHPEDRSQALLAMERAIADLSPLELEGRFRESVDCDWQWMLVRGVVIQSERGIADRLVGVAVDITERKRTEQALQASEEKFRQFSAHIDAVLWMASLDACETIYVSPAYEKIWDRSCESAYADPSSWLEVIYADDREVVETFLMDQNQFGSAQAEYRIVHSDGSIHWIWDQGFAIRDQLGQIICYGGIAQDISERKQAELTLRKSQQQLQAVLDHSPAAIYLIDDQNRLLLASQTVADLATKSVEEIIGKSLYELWPKEMADLWAANNQRVLDSLELLQTEEIVLQADGIHTFLTVKVPFFDETGRAYAVCGISTDITSQ
jgi:PAS domain S-box-containing protein